MSGVEFKPCGGGDESQANILLPLGKSVVGRGSLLGIGDKRVSRNHGMIEVEDGKVKIMPTHSNPTFYQPSEGSKLEALEKDIWQTLSHGDKVGLTPDQHVFEVILQDRPINASQSLKASMVESSPEKTPAKPSKTDNDAKIKDNNKAGEQHNGDDKKSDEERSTEDEEQKEVKSDKKTVSNKKPKEDDEKTDTKDDDDDEDTKDTNGVDEEPEDEEEDKAKKPKPKKSPGGKKGRGRPPKKDRARPQNSPTRTMPSRGEKQAHSYASDSDDDYFEEYVPRPTNRTEKIKTVKLDDGKEVALPGSKERTLPNWMDKGDDKDADMKEEKDPDAPKAKGRGRPKKDGTPAKAKSPKSSQEVDDDEETPPKKGRGRPPKGGAKKGGRGRPRKQSGGDEEVEARPPKAMAKRKEYSDDDDDGEEEEPQKIVYKDDDDWMLSEEEVESDISDWEDAKKSHKAKKPKPKKSPGGKKGRGRPPKNPTRSTPSRGKKRAKSYFSDSDDDYYEEELYVPKPTKRTAGRLASSQSAAGSDDDDRPVKASPKVKPKAKTKRTPAKKIKKNKKPCQYGKDCYRKNPSHIKEFCHPGDSDYPEESDEEMDEGEEGKGEEGKEKEECPHGPDCYRTSKAHLKQYKHTPPPAANRPKREAAQKKAMVIQGDRSSLLQSGVSDDDGAPNTYDDNDAFLDEAIMGSDNEAEKAKASDDSDWDPAVEPAEVKGAAVKKVKAH